MKAHTLFLLILSTLIVMSCQSNNKGNDNAIEENAIQMDKEEIGSEQLIINLEAKSGSDLSGAATFTQSDGEVSLKATINGLSEGEHAIHIHEKGDCSAADGTSAGGHWNPTNQPHGKWGDANGYHKGDIGNFNVDANGVGLVEFSTDEWCIGCNDPQKI